MVSGMMPNTLKLTQKSVVWVRHTTSFTAARKKKNRPQRKVSLRQPSWVRSNTLSSTRASNGRPKARPPSSTAPNRLFTMVGLSLMNTSSRRSSVRPPNTTTTTPETSGMIGRRRTQT